MLTFRTMYYSWSRRNCRLGFGPRIGRRTSISLFSRRPVGSDYTANSDPHGLIKNEMKTRSKKSCFSTSCYGDELLMAHLRLFHKIMAISGNGDDKLLSNFNENNYCHWKQIYD